MEEPYNEIFCSGDHIILELFCDDIFEGDYCDGGKNRIDLVNTMQHNNSNKLEGVYSFYRTEIAKIHTLRKKLIEKTIQASNDTNDGCKRLKLIEEEYDRLKRMSWGYVYLERADNRYYEAVKNLAQAETLGVVSLGMEDNRTAIIRLLVISTWQHVYIFDMINFKNRFFYPELKDIFESKYICKVIHKGGPLVDILYRNYDIYVQNVFDTEVVDLIILKNKLNKTVSKTRDISECLVEYLNFPSSLLKNALDTPSKKWIERPLSDRRKLYSSQLVTYLVILKEEMLKILYSEVYKAINDVHDFYFYLDNYEFSQKVLDGKISKEIDNLIPILSNNCLNDKKNGVSPTKENG